MSGITLSDAIELGIDDGEMAKHIEEAIVRAIVALGPDRAVLSTNGNYVFYVRDGELYSLTLVTPSPYL